MNLTIRRATAEDVPFLADLVMLASHGPYARGFIEECVGPDLYGAYSFAIEYVRCADNPWGWYSHFLVAEVAGEIAAAMNTVPTPKGKAAPAFALPRHAFESIRQRLGWGDDHAARVAQRLDNRFGDPDLERVLTPVGDACITWFATFPRYRKRGLVTRLMHTSLRFAKDQGLPMIDLLNLRGLPGTANLLSRQGFVLSRDYFIYDRDARIEYSGLSRYTLDLTRWPRHQP